MYCSPILSPVVPYARCGAHNNLSTQPCCTQPQQSKHPNSSEIGIMATEAKKVAIITGGGQGIGFGIAQ